MHSLHFTPPNQTNTSSISRVACLSLRSSRASLELLRFPQTPTRFSPPCWGVGVVRTPDPSHQSICAPFCQLSPEIYEIAIARSPEAVPDREIRYFHTFEPLRRDLSNEENIGPWIEAHSFQIYEIHPSGPIPRIELRAEETMSSSLPNSHHPPSSSAEPVSQSVPNTSTDANNSYTPNDSQLAGLVEAATAAADQDVSEWTAAAAVAAVSAAPAHLDGYSTDIHLGDDGFGDSNFGASMGGGRHLRVPNDHSQGSGLSRTVSKKRKRNDDNLDPALTRAGLSGSQQHSQASQHNTHGYTGDDMRSAPPHSWPKTHSAGVHSTSMPSRQRSTNKKSSRPSVEEMERSLELSKDNWLVFKEESRNYMLDPEHPERRNCVGHRGSGNGEKVRRDLELCAEDLLGPKGYGDRFFSEHTINEGMPPRNNIWPRDRQKIVDAVVHVLRRALTNARQCQYAIETRKGGGAEARRRRKTSDSFQDFNSSRLLPEQQVQMQQTHRADGLGQAMPPPPPPLPQPQPSMDTTQLMDLGLTDLFLDGYTMDWNDISRSYDMYNRDFELDNLWSLSGLQQPDWRGLVAAVDSHYYVIHNGDCHCPPGCEAANVDRIIHSSSTLDLPWRIGGGRNLPARDEFASSITRDVSRVIRENIASRNGDPMPHPQMSSSDGHFHSHHPLLTPQDPNNQGINSPSNGDSQGQLYLHINVLQEGKRIVPRLDLPAGECPNVDLIKQYILRRYPGQIPGVPPLQSPDLVDLSAAASWRIKVWLPNGLMAVQGEKDWGVALLSAHTVDWMDGDLKVLVEVEGTKSGQ
ncbi:uncharacterized protein N7459_002186 [Penicillium hispanicum]|uniref:uncharacterized protein n=1 Tax=Penicillium hispanicum TaxID=1080232 RepID=UPI002541C080|nr:uncharacterized protein N7459_002186 [Penicillium hispanicum]KAJ5591817.1 hypothetical protein N7459_002186 [Penicillium hispanicum]